MISLAGRDRKKTALIGIRLENVLFGDEHGAELMRARCKCWSNIQLKVQVGHGRNNN